MGTGAGLNCPLLPNWIPGSDPSSRIQGSLCRDSTLTHQSSGGVAPGCTSPCNEREQWDGSHPREGAPGEGGVRGGPRHLRPPPHRRRPLHGGHHPPSVSSLRHQSGPGMKSFRNWAESVLTTGVRASRHISPWSPSLRWSSRSRGLLHHPLRRRV